MLFLSCSNETNYESETNGTPDVEVNDDTATEEAVLAANQWLALIDSNEYDRSWQATASILQDAISSEKWEIALNGVLPAYGKINSRELISATPMKELPGAPKGEYVVIQFKSSFEFKDGIETITPMKEDGVWKVSGYFIK